MRAWSFLLCVAVMLVATGVYAAGDDEVLVPEGESERTIAS